MTHKLIPPAVKLCELLEQASDQKLDHEILVLDSNTVGIVVDIDGVDYILSMMRLPRQRVRPSKN
ncbi:hypothetical protein G6L45_16170 [Agrobacterium rhizogenes]|nr:hypothetical protein [Rhizobium rhizogenes]NTH97020.1 hypothetical protein [Rhizobium rhizogenes]NTJ15206.1 hypothetical protein [Rhizobium rhizogenes]